MGAFRIISFLLLVLVMPLAGAGQPLSLRNAIDSALLNNYDIRIAKNEAEISRINNRFGVAGGMPVVSVGAGDNYSSTFKFQKFNDETENSQSGVGENSLNAGISAGVLLFNGFRVIAAKERLNLLENQSQMDFNLQVQNTIADVMMAYFDIFRQESYLKIMQHSLNVSKQKFEIVSLKNSVGMADGAEMLQAQTDVISAEQQLALQQMEIAQIKTDLLQKMSAKNHFPFEISDSIIVDGNIVVDSVLNLLNNNPQYLSALQQVQINEQLVREVSAQRYPSLRLNGAFDYFQTDISKGNVLLNRNYGPSAGVSLQIPVFNGGIYKTQRKIARIRVETANLESQKLKSALQAEAIRLYASYATALEQIELQNQNFALTRQLVDVVLNKFNLNQATILDVKAAQSSFENAAYLLVNLQFSAKVAEIELKRLMFRLDF